MKTFAQALYYGCFMPRERDRVQDPEYTYMRRKINDIQVHFQSVLKPEDRKLFDELEDLYIQSATIEDIDAFAYGLNMGILLMIDVIEFKNERKED